MIDVSPFHLEIIQRILNKHVPDAEVRAFGSRVTWTAKDYSDLDLAVVGKEKFADNIMYALKEDFEESDLPFRVEVLDWNGISKEFKQVIEKKYEVIQKINDKVETGEIPEGWEQSIFSEAVNVNPKRELKKESTAKFVSMADLKEFNKKIQGFSIRQFSGGSKFANGDTVMARITPCLENGKTAFVDILNTNETGVGSTEFIVLCGKENRSINQFVYYLATSTEIRQKAIKSMIGTSGRQRVESDVFDKIYINLPSLTEQRAIAKILSDLDEKIELNHWMNKTLEEIAQAIFKRWFVEFEFPALAPRPPKGGERGEGARVLNSADKKLYAKLEEKAMEMRNNPTEAESKMWEELRNNKLGMKFRRQHVIDKFIVDFYCVEKALVVEIDGDVHDLQKERDKERESVLKNLGCEIVRFSNKQVLDDIRTIINEISVFLKRAPHPPEGGVQSGKSPLGNLGADLLAGYKSSGGKMIDSELGEIPEVWRVSKIGDEFETILGGTPSTINKSYWNNGTIPWINSGEINEFRITKPTAFITEEAVNNSATKLMTKETTVLAITGATLGQVSRIEIDTCANQSVIGILENENIPSEYIYLWTKHKIIDLISNQTGGAQQHINKNNVNELEILLPNSDLLSKFKEVIKPIFKNISINCFESQNLFQIRNSLLLKLISGKIRVT